MGQYDFDSIIERRGTGALKTDALQQRYGNAGLLPLWVADMDFATPPFIVDALKKRMEHPIFGYTVEPDDFWPCVQDWILEHHGWKVEREWLTYIPGIVKGIGMAINAFLAPDEKVIIQPPVYHPFRLVPQGNGREVVYNPLGFQFSHKGVSKLSRQAKTADQKKYLLGQKYKKRCQNNSYCCFFSHR